MKRLLLFVLAAAHMGCGRPSLHNSASDLEVNPLSLDFGAEPAGATARQKISLTNAGASPISLTTARIDSDARGAFRLPDPLPSTLEAGASFDLRVEYDAPSSPGSDTAALTLESNAQNAGHLQISLSGTSVEESEDGGSWIAFDSNRDQGNRDIYVIRTDGTRLQRLTHDLSDREPAFSPDGTQLAFASDRSGVSQIYVMTLATNAEVQVTQATTSSSLPAWSPDGKQLAFQRDVSVYVISPDGTGEQRVAQGADPLNPCTQPAYVPSGQWIVLECVNEIDAVQPDGGSQRTVVPSFNGPTETPSVSPSGAQVVFSAMCTSGEEALYTAPIGGVAGDACHATPQQVIPGRRPAWGPGFIAYEVPASFIPVSSVSDIWLVPAQGGTPFNLTQNASDNRNPAWAPAGTVLP